MENTEGIYDKRKKLEDLKYRYGADFSNHYRELGYTEEQAQKIMEEQFNLEKELKEFDDKYDQMKKDREKLEEEIKKLQDSRSEQESEKKKSE